MHEQLSFEAAPAVRLPLSGIPLQEMLDAINAEHRGLYVHMVR